MHYYYQSIIIVIIIIGWALANITSDIYPEHPPHSFYNPVSLRLPLPRQSFLILVGHVLVDIQGLSTISF